jgi:hypothetical protein
MRFDVKFVTPFSESKPVRFVGKGAVHLLETAIVFEGPCSDVFVPLISIAVRSITSRWQIRTVPYASIVRHGPPRLLLLRRTHHLHYVDVDGVTRAIGFRIRRTRGINATEFATRLQDYRQACQRNHFNA